MYSMNLEFNKIMNHLFTPLTIKELTLKNRVVVSPMQQYNSKDGFASDWHLVHLGSRAVGGAGLILTESAAVNPIGRSTYNDLGMWKDEHILKWQQINNFIHQQDAKIGIQLGHFGSKGSRSHPSEGLRYMNEEAGGWQTVSASTIAPFSGTDTPKELNQEEIEQIIIDFANAAKRSVEAGFDVIELHFAHGYLVHQFLSKLINQRNDEYGGNFENRIRLALEIVEAIKKVIPDTMPLLVKISAVDFVEGKDAWMIEDSIEFAKMLKQAGVDVITASAGGFTKVDKSILKQGYQVGFAKQIKEKANILTAAVGLITDPSYANTIIQDESCDLVLLAREHLRNPYFSLLAAKELEAEVAIPWQYKRGF